MDHTTTATPTVAPTTIAAMAIPATLLPAVGMVVAAVGRSRSSITPMLMFEGLDGLRMRFLVKGRLLDCIDYTGPIGGGVLAISGV